MPGASTPAADALAAFRAAHSRDADGVWSAPGRVNLIGEHTDYNDGYVLPFALSVRIAAAAATRSDGLLTVAGLDADGRVHRAEPMALADLRPGHPTGWQSYPAGVAWVLREQGVVQDGAGADIVLAGDVPTGAGLSSSAAVECAVAMAMLGLSGHPDPTPERRMRIAEWAQRAENEFVGAPTGLLDQAAAMCCTAGHALFFDVRSGVVDQVPFDAARAGTRVLVIDTRTRHAHGESGYGQRRRGTERAATSLGVRALRDIPTGDLPAALAELPDELRPLVRHVVTENQRVLDVVGHLRGADTAGVTAIGPVLDASHASLRDDYRVSSAELDLAVDAARGAGALGARMTGGGFGGSVIALVHEDDERPVRAAVDTAFEQAGLNEPRVFTALPSAGAATDRKEAMQC